MTRKERRKGYAEAYDFFIGDIDREVARMWSKDGIFTAWDKFSERMRELNREKIDSLVLFYEFIGHKPKSLKPRTVPVVETRTQRRRRIKDEQRQAGRFGDVPCGDA